MKALRAFAVTLALLGSAPLAQAQVVDLSKTTCKEFLESGKDGIMIIWAWLYGYYADQDADPVVDFAKLTAGYELYGKAEGDAWSLAAVPRDPMVRNAIGDIFVEGQGDAVRQIAAERGKLIKTSAAEAFVQHLGHAYPQNDLLKEMFGGK